MYANSLRAVLLGYSRTPLYAYTKGRAHVPERLSRVTKVKYPDAGQMRQRTWSKGDYAISTDPTRIQTNWINQVFGSDEMSWAVKLSDDKMKEMVANALCFGVYRTEGHDDEAMIGFGRLATDFVTFAYLSDLYVLPAHRRHGIATWLLTCIKEVCDSMPYLRKIMALTSHWDLIPWFHKILGMVVMGGTPPGDGRDEDHIAVIGADGKGAVL